MKIKLIVTILILLALVAGGTLMFYSLFAKVENRPESEVVVGSPNDIPVNSTKLVPGHGIFLVNNGEGIYAVSNKCTHLQCPIDWEEKEKKFNCDCHGSSFDAEGKVIKAPANKPLPRFAIRFDKKVGLIVDTAKFTQDEAIWWKEPYFYAFGVVK